MRNDNLKKALNDIPQDFDQEQLWNSIELPQKKHKNRNAFWFLVFGISFVGILLFILHNEGYKIIKTNVDGEKISEEKPIQNLSSEQYASVQESESDQINKQNKFLEENKVVPKALNDKMVELINSKSGNTTNTNSNLEISNINNVYGVANLKLKLPSQEIEKLEKELDITRKSEVDIQRQMEKKSEINSEDYFMNDLNTEGIKGLETTVAQKAQSIISGQDEREFLIVQNLPLKRKSLMQYKKECVGIDKMIAPIKMRKAKPFIYGLSFNSFLGNDSHQFKAKEDVINRSENEKPLESFGLSILGHLQIGKVEFYSGVLYMQYNTLLTFSTQEKSIINSLEGPSFKNLSTDYSLFNSYQYVDLLAGVGYEVSISDKWSLIPSIQVVYSVTRNLRGVAFSFDNYSEVYFVGNHYNFYSRWQGQANLKIERKISDKLNAGVIFYGNTEKALGLSDSNPHNVISHGLGISIKS